jgi:hypothetical protein
LGRIDEERIERMLQLLKGSETFSSRGEELGALDEGKGSLDLSSLQDSAVRGLKMASLASVLRAEQPRLSDLGLAVDECGLTEERAK